MPASALALKGFFAPKSAAIVGASEDLSKFGGRLMKAVIDFGFTGELYPVNPGRKEIFGRTAYPSIADLPHTPEHVGIVLPIKHVMPALEQCAARGVKFVTLNSGGYAEAGTDEGRARQEELKAFAQRTGMRIMGPNCNGFVNYVDGFALTNTGAIRGGRRPAGNVAVVGQSGGLAQMNVMWRAMEAGLAISYQVSCGNEADIDAIEFAQFMVEEEASDVILLAMESIRSGPRFCALAEAAAERRKPLLMLKFGKTEAGSRAAASHTGAITGADDVVDAACRQFGVIRVNDCPELYEYAKLLRTRRIPRGPRVAAMSGSGGHAVLAADTGAQMSLEWPAFSARTQLALEQLVPDMVALANPLDLTSAQTGSPQLFPDALNAIVADEVIDTLVPILVVPTRSGIEQLVAVHDTIAKPMAVLWTGYCAEDGAITAASLNQRGVPTYRDAGTCLRAVRTAVDYGAFLQRFEARPRPPQRIVATEAASTARSILAKAGKVATERVSKLALAAYGLAITSERLTRSADEAVRAAAEIGGAVALKIESADIPHKTEAGGVRLSVNGDTAIRAAFDDIMSNARTHAPQARLDGVLVQAMAPRGVEMMLGVTRDATFGAVVSVAMGGMHVEVLRDIAHGIAPLDQHEARRMVDSLAGRKLLDGARGAPPCDIDALCDAIVRLSWFAMDFENDIAELDINPLLVLPCGQGALIVDALIVRHEGEDGQAVIAHRPDGASRFSTRVRVSWL